MKSLSGERLTAQLGVVEVNDKEKWAPIKDFEDYYAVSSLGRVKRLARWSMNSSGGTSRLLKDRIRVRDNFICQLCGVPELECKQRLDIHHIDYNKKNNKKDNLITLCLWCNIRANYNRDYWKDFYRIKQDHLSEE